MNFTSEQHDRLIAFTKQHFVDYYDVQQMIVKDLKVKIHEQIEADPELNFDEALQKAFKTYGVCGFSDDFEKYTKQINKQCWSYTWQTTKGILQESKLWLGVLLIFFCSVLFLSWNPFNSILAISVAGLAMVFALIMIIKRRKKIKHRQYNLYMEELLSNSVGFLPFTYLPWLVVSNLYNYAGDLWYINYIVAAIITLEAIALYILNFKLPEQKREILEKYLTKNDLDADLSSEESILNTQQS
ncbi:hypothetical protein [Psychroflexus aestuariivivens]|uniref:hypothetical protein n=1 Tax=Psychroflexus aestuariivivens TaxID=1795040 RepID=UPI000FDAE738|nr:hypothetical protein [Psychroflexus aestuariivivens]